MRSGNCPFKTLKVNTEFHKEIKKSRQMWLDMRKKAELDIFNLKFSFCSNKEELDIKESDFCLSDNF